MFQCSKIICAIAIVMLLGQAAHAAAPTEVKSSFRWTGLYAGAFAAHSWAKLKYYEPDWPGFDRNPNINGFTGGVVLGYNYQSRDSIVYGIEADAGLGDLKKGADASAYNNYSAFEIDWTAHARGRVGIVSNSTLLYVAAGLAIAEITVDDKDPKWGKDDATHVGWTVGAGIEHALTGNMLARVEYLYDDYGSKDYMINGLYSYKANVDLTAHTIRVGLFYRF